MVAEQEFFKYMKKAKEHLGNAKKFEFFFYIDIALKMLNNYEYNFMTKEEIATNLKMLNFDTKLINSVIYILNMCDKFKFTNIMISNNEMKKIYAQVYFIKELSDKIIL